ncbi:unnamed protein product [Didymodactylos carnosus]|uniref:Uncharacterized protein n=2 Tax=Didymodactylos carnosus TaxID=1234261 RepID=A0A815DEU4_9BILA|nr:unnamed protein product [Didymodactylos carnosus]CAF4110918.1 unnamed protein product [Didymodactylos carnosus]
MLFQIIASVATTSAAATTDTSSTTTNAATTRMVTTGTTTLKTCPTSYPTNYSSATSPSPALTGAYGTNIVVNGDGETGRCLSSGNTVFLQPTGWTVSGLATQISYLNTAGDQSLSSIGPSLSERGCCYFIGGQSPPSVTTMMQTINVTAYAVDIDSNLVYYNLSAWMGGWGGQDDNARVSFQFLSQTLSVIGNSTEIGPVLDADRGGTAKLMYRSAAGMVLVNTRYINVVVTMTRVYVTGALNDGDIDNVEIVFSK